MYFVQNAVPGSAPTDVMTTVVSSTEIMVTWGIVPPIDQNGVITMYEVLYQPQETFNGAITDLTVNVSAQDMSVVLMNLEEYVNYTISVRAYTSVGEGPYSEGIVELTDEDGNFIECKFLCFQSNFLSQFLLVLPLMSWKL